MKIKKGHYYYTEYIKLPLLPFGFKPTPFCLLRWPSLPLCSVVGVECSHHRDRTAHIKADQEVKKSLQL